MSEIQKQNIGNAGEYYIASRLSAKNFITSITLGRAEKYDIIAVNEKDKTFKISVKTSYSIKSNGFPLCAKDEINGSDDFYYAFVLLKEYIYEPDFWIIPSKIVNELISYSHQCWLKQKSKTGKVHNDSPMRKLLTSVSDTTKKCYPNNWNDELKTYYKNIEQLK